MWNSFTEKQKKIVALSIYFAFGLGIVLGGFLYKQMLG
jgi:hypothetical protein